MEKNKRFTIDVENNNYENAFFLGDKFICYEDDYDSILKLLNVLYEEIEQLKIFLEALKEELSLANRDNDALEEENEQLKQEIENLQEQLAHIGEVFE